MKKQAMVFLALLLSVSFLESLTSLGVARAEGILSGGHGVCAINNEYDLKCWAPYKELPLGYDASKLTPPESLGKVLAFSSSEGNTCAIQKTNYLYTSGPVFCWGAPGFLDQTKRFFKDALATKVAVTRTNACIIKVDGSLRCLRLFPPTYGEYKNVKLSEKDACAIRVDNQVVCWGENKYGRQVPPADLGETAQLSMSDGKTCAVTTVGKLRCWGVLGLTDFSKVSLPKYTQVLGGIIDVQLYVDWICTIDKKQDVKCFSPGLENTNVAPKALGKATQIAIEYDCLCLGSETGRVSCSKLGSPSKEIPVAFGYLLGFGKTLTYIDPLIIFGTPMVGKTLAVNPGVWADGFTYQYQWLRNGLPIKGATKSNYTLLKTDKGKKIAVKVTGSESHYIPASTISDSLLVK